MKKRRKRCPRCGGTGKENIAVKSPSDIIKCRTCGGTGYLEYDGQSLGGKRISREEVE